MPIKQVPPVLSIDWFQIHCIPKTAAWKTYHPFFTVKKMDFGTRHFSLIEELWQDEKRVATVCSKPYSPVLGKSMMLIKFDNWLLYGKDLATWIPWFLQLNELEFKNISRIDICADFNTFPNGMNPSNFIKKFTSATCLKMGKVNLFTARGSQEGTKHHYTGLRFGSLLSEISYYLYDKTKEMKEQTHKPWIQNLWVKSGLNINIPVYRLEFSIKSSGKVIVNTETGENRVLTSMEILKRNMLELTYNLMLNRFWKFVWNDGQVKRGRMRQLKMFPEKFAQYIIMDTEGLHDSTRSHKIFIKKLEETMTELRGKSFDLAIAASDLKVEMINSRGLQQWAQYKGFA